MLKNSFFIILISFAILAGCSNDDTVSPPPVTGEVLLATVAGDSVGVTSGSISRSISITSNQLNFAGHDSARISFYYSGENNLIAAPFTIYYKLNDTTDVTIFSEILFPTNTEQVMYTGIPSPRQNVFCEYKIATNSSPGFSYFKFRDLKIYAK